MNSINIPSTEIKKFMNCLLVGDTFDKFLIEEATITTFNTFTIDGHIQKDFFLEDELTTLHDVNLSTWANIKPICFNLIKGNKLPLRFKIVLKASVEYTEKILEENPCGLAVKDVGGLYINIRYENNGNASLDCISMASLNIFSMDKTLDKAWDGACEKFIGMIGE